MAYKRSSKKNVYGKGRRTYQGGTTAGRNGTYHYKQKILVRYSGESANKIAKRAQGVINAIYKETREVLKDVIISRKWILEKCKTYYLKALRKYCPVDTGMLRDSFKVRIVNGWLEWENNAGEKDSKSGKGYVFAQNYGKSGITPTGGVYYYPGYYFLQKANFALFIYMTNLIKQEAQKVKNKAIQRGAK